MLKIVRTQSTNQDFINLVKHLDKDLAKRDGDDHAFYHQFNDISVLKHVILIYDDDKPIACGAIKGFDLRSAEVKRMYTKPGYRGQGIATKTLNSLELWAAELGYITCVLEAGKRQPEAIALYLKNGYLTTDNYGQYIGIDNSVCFIKQLNKNP